MGGSAREEDILEITREDLKEFHKKHFGFIPEDDTIMGYEEDGDLNGQDWSDGGGSLDIEGLDGLGGCEETGGGETETGKEVGGKVTGGGEMGGKMGEEMGGEMGEEDEGLKEEWLNDKESEDEQLEDEQLDNQELKHQRVEEMEEVNRSDQMKRFKRSEILDQPDSSNHPISTEQSAAWLPTENPFQHEYEKLYGSYSEYHLGEDEKIDNEFIKIAKKYRVRHYYPILPINL